VVTALQGNSTINGLFDVRLDDQDVPFGVTAGDGIVNVASRAVTQFGSGAEFDQASGLQIVNGSETYTIDIESAQTVEDLLNSINGSAAHALAEINDAGNGIRIRSRLSGSDFTIGENGGSTATQLGVRSSTTSTFLSELNYGSGVQNIDGVDFTIRRNDGVDLGIDIASARTIGDVINLINNHPDNLDPSTRVVARLTAFGNGIELVDDNPQAGGNLTVLPAFGSTAAWQLGLTAQGATQSAPPTPATAATAGLAFGIPNNLNTAMRLTANQPGTAGNGVQVIFQNTLVGDTASAVYDSGTNQLTVSLDSTQTTANTIIAAIQAEGTFSAALDTSVDATNDGSGVVGTTGTIATTGGGTAQVLKARDTNPLEVSGVFNTLLRLKTAVSNFDLGGMERAVDMLDIDFDRVSFSRADLGSRGHAFDLLKDRIADEEVQLKATLSQEIEVDFVQSVSDLTARQAALEATLRLSGQTLKMTLLDFL
jgi:flagellar hook-associated protein 3 FlgL